MQIAHRPIRSKFIETPKPLAETGAIAEKTALVRFLQRILRPSSIKPQISCYPRKKFAAIQRSGPGIKRNQPFRIHSGMNPKQRGTMARPTNITYEAVRQAANRFLATKGRKPTNLEMQRELGGGTDVMSRHMNTWREEIRALERGKAVAAPSPLDAAFSAAVATAVAEETLNLAEQLAEVREDAEDLRNELADKSEELANTQDTLDRERQRNTVLETQLNDARIDATRHLAELGRANEDRIRLNQDLGRHQSDLSAERQKSTMLEAQLAAASATLAELTQQVQELTINLAVAQNRRQEKTMKEAKQ